MILLIFAAMIKTIIGLPEQQTQSRILLAYCGKLHLLLAVVILLIMPFEHRQIMGINLWVKPLKFALSIGIYCISWSVILQFLKNEQRNKWFSRFTVFAMTFEMMAIFTQAARGELSHFNQTGHYNVILYGLMGIIITGQTIYSIFISIPLFTRNPEGLSKAMRWALRLGIGISILFALQGGLMGARMAHTVGAADGRAGLPLLNWSRDYGDLRIAHFFGLHALQILPAFVWLYPSKRATPILVFGLLYFLLVSFVFYHALLGKGY